MTEEIKRKRVLSFLNGATTNGDVKDILEDYVPQANEVIVDFPEALGLNSHDFELKNGKASKVIAPVSKMDYKRKRAAAFKAELPAEDQLDAFWKYIALTPAEKDALLPDDKQPVDTPAGAWAKWNEIKQRHKKQ